MRSAVLAFSRWLVPSLVGAAVAVIVAGLVEGRAQGTRGLVASIGYTWIAAGPYAVIIALIVRAIARAWRPAELRLVEPDGSAPLLAGWLGALWIATAFVLWTMMQATWRIAAWTAWKPLTAGFLAAGFAVLTVLIAVAFTPPLARGLAWSTRSLDERWRRRGHRSLARPGVIISVLVSATVVALVLVWLLFAARRLKSVELGAALGPVAGLAAPPLAHAGWYALRARLREGLGIVMVVLVGAAVAIAVRTTRTHPALALEIWGAQPLARTAITRIADVETIRAALPPATFRPAARPNAAHPDLVLVTLGGVQADATPPYGGGAEMPVLRELGRQASLFQQTFASSPGPIRALRALLTGLDDARIRARPVLDPRHVLLADRLRGAGYETAAFICCEEPAEGLARGLAHVVVDTDGARLAEQARDWIMARDRTGTQTPLFVWIHLALPPGAPAASPSERRAQYNARLAGTDASLRQIIAGWQARVPARSPILVVVGQTGVGLDDRPPSDQLDLASSYVRIPFLVTGPQLRVQQIAEPVSALDVVPTVLDLAGYTPPRPLDGRSLAPIIRGEQPSQPTEGAAYARWDRMRMAVRGQWKLVLRSGEPALYDLRADPFERTNQAARRSYVVAQLTKLLDERERALKLSPF